ncbi:CTP synthase [Candidatus Amesbacteria bacterium RIFCSPHIGHO2_01_FULL_48_32]|uniref:CTP synthase n=1 Tax=Candidatus Amesbacteria bacterium RIFCSPLOWO2_01_FULL_48_25 TaxID=1797259 RepID=A0A1F4ZDU0_9BACT|nr:MAG: CTP synthase [Candidatus Amesbacteria bacterium RIFCSPHIGHO2_01_FULL_48_32]OGD04325.1 MAG: CTP synthase [Candidatus Amesbacteria bacterium RIFCSPLOWO2_01_FULL_48_25]
MPRVKSKTKYIFVSGGVISGLGKGITAASIGMLLKSRGIRVTNVKIDMYLNVDAGTIRPQEHGEVFVTDDGIETDQDIGHYERFLNESLKRENYMTTGQVYKTVIDRERAFGYNGEDVEAIPHVTDEIIGRIVRAGEVNQAQIVVVELGGTVGEYQNGLFFEANRIMKLREPENVLHVHVSYLPVIRSVGELKSKPTQQSVHVLNSMGIQPDFLVARSEQEIDARRRERLALFCNMHDGDIIANPDLTNIYQVPLFLDEQGLTDKVLKKLAMKPGKRDLGDWGAFVRKLERGKKQVKIAMVGKYFATGSYVLKDSYICVIEALNHAAAKCGVKLIMDWFNSDEVGDMSKALEGFDGVIVPQGWGSRGVEGKIAAVKFAREKKVPYLGLCFGMQMAVIEYARNMCGMKGANSTEVDAKTKFPVIHIMPDQKKYLDAHQYGGTIRLGAWPCVLKEGAIIFNSYKNSKSEYLNSKQIPNSKSKIQNLVYERHRHRYEVNNKYREVLEKKGLVVSGVSPDGKLVEAIELPQKTHPFFVGTQFHPEYKSRPLSPHPIFVSFIEAAGKLT